MEIFTLMIGRMYNLNTGEIVSVINSPGVLKQRQDSIICNAWDLSSVEVSYLQRNVPWFKHLYNQEFNSFKLNREVLDSTLLLLKHMECPDNTTTFKDWFSFWGEFTLKNHVNSGIQLSKTSLSECA